MSREIRKQPGKLGNRAGFLEPGRVLSEWPVDVMSPVLGSKVSSYTPLLTVKGAAPTGTMSIPIDPY